MPRDDAADVARQAPHAAPLLDGFELHDVWRVDLDGNAERTLAELAAHVEGGGSRPGIAVQALFGLRRALGGIFGWDREPAGGERVLDAIPDSLRSMSVDPPGTPRGPFTTLYALPREAAYEIVNATVHAVLVVALERRDGGQRFWWATYLRPVGRATAFYMGLIDPFRRFVVYPGLERWLKRAWSRA